MAQEMGGLGSRRGGDSSLELSPSVVYMEACENYQKQSYRNRCRFYAADGVQALSFPIVHEEGTHKLPISEIKSSGYVVDTLEAAIWCLMTTASYKECVLKAIGLFFKAAHNREEIQLDDF